MAQLPSPPDDGSNKRRRLINHLASCHDYDFILRPSQQLYRVHEAIWGPWYFCHEGKYRFDLPAPNGTCYVGEGKAGAFLEHFPRFLEEVIPIPGRQVDAARLSKLTIPSERRLIDCTLPRVLGEPLGLNAKIHSSEDRPLTQAWARFFFEAGFEGVRYWVSSDPSQRQVGIAIFGGAGEAGFRYDSPDPIPPDLLQEVERIWRVRVVW